VTGRPQTDFSSRGVIEVGPSMENRTINSSTFGGKPTPTRESLRIANWVYTRSGNDGWTRMQYSATPTAKETEESPFQVLSSQAEYTYLGEGKLMDKPVQIFLKTERQTKVNQKSGEASETESRNKYWIGPNGMVLKSDFIAETRGKTTSRTTVVMEWQIDPSITFTLPEIFP
jgi:hypothetical protein